VLKLVNEIIGDNKTVAESFCVMGGIPSTLQFSGKNYYYQIRQETAQFVSKMLTLGKKAIKMFIACRGLPVLVDLLDVNGAFSNAAFQQLCARSFYFSFFDSLTFEYCDQSLRSLLLPSIW
jgi:hypothetical protein